MFKKIFYSGITRAAAYLLIAACLTAAMIAFGNYQLYNDGAYKTEEEYTDSSYIYYELHDAAKTLMDALLRSEDPAVISDIMGEMPVHYYAQSGELVYTDGTAAAPNEKCGFYLRQRGDKQSIKKPSERYDYYFPETPDGDYTLYVALNEKTREQFRHKWQAGKSAFEGLINLTVGIGFLLLVLAVYCIVVCGRRNDGSRCELKCDKIYAEVWAALFVLPGMLGVGVSVSVLEELAYGGNPSELLWRYSAAASAVVITLSCGALLPIIRNIKNGKIRERSLAARAVCWCLTSVRQAVLYLRGHKTDKVCYIAAAAVVVYTLALSMFRYDAQPIWFALMAAAIAGVFKALSGLDAVIRGINEIKNGNTDYKIENVHGIFESAADAVNTIGSGISAAVDEKTRSERMKAELITNVSHDLKTPLTSVISYSELLCREKLEPEEANEYAQIILQKATRLKDLTADLFDISKVQSGNGNIKCTEINLALLIAQAIGELDEELKASGLELCADLPEEAYAVCDGERMSRVFENLLHNAAKYSMKNTRLYVEVAEKDGFVCAAVKNISSYKMDFTGDEITERFVRGDRSRSTEGSGLGLAIAKSYTEACGGRFCVTVDGDLFKAEIKLKRGL